jgi:hypothetical protein
MQDRDLISQYRAAFEDSERAQLRAKRWKSKEFKRLRGMNTRTQDVYHIITDNPVYQRLQDDAVDARALYIELSARVRGLAPDDDE